MEKKRRITSNGARHKSLDPRAPIYLQTKDIAKLLGISRQALNQQLKFLPNSYWQNFWTLVQYLETKNLRPNA